MMIQRIAVVALAAAIGVSAQAVEFNKDALRAMQEEGHQIVEEAEGVRQFKARGELCLDTAGNGLVVKACSDAASQKWRFDDERRLVADSGKCVVGANLRDCGAGDEQGWTYDERKRLVNGGQQCLQIPGNPPKAGTRVVAVPCSGAVGQIWR